MRALVWVTFALSITCVVLVACVCIMCATLTRREITIERIESVRMTRVDDPNLAALLIAVRIGKYDTFFQLDTGFAGAPLFSAKHLAVEQDEKVTRVSFNDLEGTYRDRVSRIRAKSVPAVETLREALREKVGCESFTAGCSMNALSIGMTEKRHNELLHCECLQLQTDADAERFACPLKNNASLGSDVMMISMIHGPHILTSDWLFQLSPCVMWMRDQKLEFPRGTRSNWLRKTFSCRRIRLSGGAPVLKVSIGNRHALKILIDTGAATGLTIDTKHEELVEKVGRKLTLKGSAGETLCGDVGRVSFGLASERLTVPVTVAQVGDNEIDGFCGLHILRAFDIFITPREVGFKRNGLDIVASTASEQPGACETRRQHTQVARMTSEHSVDKKHDAHTKHAKIINSTHVKKKDRPSKPHTKKY